MIVLAFCLWTGIAAADCPDHAEMGEVKARTCAIAERYLRAGLREGQRLVVLSCKGAPA